MSIPSQTVQDKLPDLKKMVESSIKDFSENAMRHRSHKQFVFVDSMLPEDRQRLKDLGMPQGTFNSLEAYASRLMGEFGDFNPEAVIIPTSDSVDDRIPEALMNIVRGIFYRSGIDNIKYAIYQDTIGGGYGYAKLNTQYVAERSFDQEILVKTAFDATLCGSDPYAHDPARLEGRFVFELIPLYEDEFKELYPDVAISEIAFSKPSEYGFAWASRNDIGIKVIYVCDLYLKEKKRMMLHRTRLSDGSEIVLTTAEFNKLDEEIALNQPDITSPKKIESEMRTLTTICKYRFIANKILEYDDDTNLDEFPLFFFDGNSVRIDNKQITKSYCYNAIDAQRSKNVVANCFFDELTNYRRTTVIASERSLPTDNDLFMDAYLHPEKKYATYIFRDIDDDGNPTAAPSLFPRTPIPPELYQTFTGMDDFMQTCLGSYDAQLGIQDNEISGNAIVKGAAQTSAAARPYLNKFLASWTQLVKAIVQMIPKYYNTPRTIPVVDKVGRRSYQRINDPADPNSINIKQVDPNVFDVYVKAGASYQLQKDNAVQTMITLSQSSAGIANVLNSPQGTDVLLDNLDILGKEKLKAINDQLAEQAQEQAQQQQSQGQQQDPAMMIEQAKLQQSQQKMQQDAQQYQQDHQIRMAQLANDQHANQIKASQLQHQQTMDYLQLLAEQDRAKAEIAKAQDESERANAELRLKRIQTAVDQYKFHVNKTHELKNDEYNKLRDYKNENQS